MPVCKQPFSEFALRISLNSCILLAHIRRKNVSLTCGKKSQHPKCYPNLESTIKIFLEILQDGGTLINKSDSSGYPQKNLLAPHWALFTPNLDFKASILRSWNQLKLLF